MKPANLSNLLDFLAAHSDVTSNLCWASGHKPTLENLVCRNCVMGESKLPYTQEFYSTKNVDPYKGLQKGRIGVSRENSRYINDYMTVHVCIVSVRFPFLVVPAMTHTYYKCSDFPDCRMLAFVLFTVLWLSFDLFII